MPGLPLDLDALDARLTDLARRLVDLEVYVAQLEGRVEANDTRIISLQRESGQHAAQLERLRQHQQRRRA